MGKKKTFYSKNRMYKIPKELYSTSLDTIVEVSGFPSKCPKCNSENICSKGTNTTEFISVDENGHFVIRHWKRNRILCKCCAKTSWPIGFDVDKQKELDTQTYQRLADSWATNPFLTTRNLAIDSQSTETGKNVSISKSTIDRIVKSRMEEMSSHIEYIPCSTIYYLSYRYKTNKDKLEPNSICAVVGIDEVNGPVYLLDLLPQYNKKEIEKLHQNEAFIENVPEISLCKLNSPIITHLKQFRKKDPGVIYDYLYKDLDKIRRKYNGIRVRSQNFHADHIKRLRKAGYTYDDIINEIEQLQDFDTWEEINKLINLFKNKQHYSVKEFTENLKDWFENFYYDSDFPWDMQEEVKKLLEPIIKHSKNCYIGAPYKWEPEFSMLQALLTQFAQTPTKFDTLRFRLLYANRVAAQNRFPQMIITCDKMITPISVRFGFDIKELYADYLQQQNFINKISQITDTDEIATLGVEFEEFDYEDYATVSNLPEFLQIEIRNYESIIKNTTDPVKIQNAKQLLLGAIYPAENNLLISSSCAKYLKIKYYL